MAEEGDTSKVPPDELRDVSVEFPPHDHDGKAAHEQGHGHGHEHKKSCTPGMLLVAFLLILLIGSLVGWLIAVNREEPTPEEVHQETQLHALARVHLALGIKLVRQLAGTGMENTILSPLSIALASVMCARGSSDLAQMEIYEATGLIKVGDEDAVSDLYQDLLGRIAKLDLSIMLSLANSAWSTSAFTPEFIYALKQYFSADALFLASAGVVNEWVNQKTHGLIPSVVNTVDPSVTLLIANSLYFKAPWKLQFNLQATYQKDFVTPTGLKKVAMMRRNRKTFMYHENDKYQIVELPFGKGTDCSAFIILPREGLRPGNLLDSMSLDMFTKLEQMEGDLSLPRMKLSQGRSFRKSFQTLGIRTVFNGDLDRMTEDPGLSLSDVTHTVVLDLDEQGTEAVPLNAESTTKPTSSAPRFTMMVDHPFFIAIRLMSTGDVLFLGYIVDPQP